MNPDDLIQLMRTCSMAQVRKALVLWTKKHPENYEVLVWFYENAKRLKP